MLWTNRAIESVDDAMLVVDNYSSRWRVEEFHRLWKSGALRIEQSQLRDAAHFERLARIAASVACRLLRLTYLARVKPKLDAEHALSAVEYRALDLLDPSRPSTPSPRKLTVAQAVILLANIGGYTGKSSGGPPGALVLTRGYRELQQSVRLLERILPIQ